MLWRINILLSWEKIGNEDNDIICVDLNVDGKPPKIELDSGWAVSIFSFDLYRQKFNRPTLKTYSGENIVPVGVLKIPVDYQTQRELLDLYVVKNKHPSFLGKDWLSTIRLAWCSIKLLQASLATLSPGERLNVMLNKYSDIFEKNWASLHQLMRS